MDEHCTYLLQYAVFDMDVLIKFYPLTLALCPDPGLLMYFNASKKNRKGLVNFVITYLLPFLA